VPSLAPLMLDGFPRRNVEMGTGSRGEIMAMESVSPQNSEPALNLPPHSCERISRTAVVLDSGTQIGVCPT
jgi:hypothetical protein